MRAATDPLRGAPIDDIDRAHTFLASDRHAGDLKQRNWRRAWELSLLRCSSRIPLGKSGGQLKIGADALKLAVTMIRNLPVLYQGRGPEVRGAITDALFTRLYIDEDRLTEAIFRPELTKVVEAYAAYQSHECAREVVSASTVPTNDKRGAQGRNRPEAPREPTLTDVLLACREPSSAGSWNTAVMAGVLGRYSNRGGDLNLRRGRVARALERPEPHVASPTWRSHRLDQRFGGEPIAAAVQAYEAGASVLELAERYRVAQSTIRKKLDESGAKLRGQKRLTPEQLNRLVQLRQDGQSHRAIALELGVSRQTISQRCSSMGI